MEALTWRGREVAALLLDLHDQVSDPPAASARAAVKLRPALALTVPRSTLLEQWVRAYPEDRRIRSASRARPGGPGSRAGQQIRRGLVELERAGLLQRRSEVVHVGDVRGLVPLAADADDEEQR